MKANARPGAMGFTIDKSDSCKPAQDAKAFALTVWERSPEKTADAHGIWKVQVDGKDQVWVVDQSGTGSVQSFQVYSSCASELATSTEANPPKL